MCAEGVDGGSDSIVFSMDSKLNEKSNGTKKGGR